jgi:hypothetical protein
MREGRAARAIVVAALIGAAAGKDATAAPRCRPRPIGPAVFDIPSVEIRPQFRLNGQPFPAAGAAVITLWASDPTDLFDGPQVVLGRTNESPEAVRLVPGVYDVYYSWESGSSIPRNQLTRILRRVSLKRDRDLVIDVPMVQVRGVKHVNGEPFVDDGSAATLRLRHADRGQVPLGGVLPAAFSIRVIPGTYSFEYDWSEGDGLPRNRHAQVRRLHLVKPVSDLVLDVPSVVQEFALLHNGGSFPQSVYDSGGLFLTRGEGEEALIGPSFASPVTVRLIPGTYDARWRHFQGESVPRNEDARFARGVLVNGTRRTLDLHSVEVSGDFRVNGQPPPQSVYDSGSISLATPDGTDRAYLGHTFEGGYRRRVVPGRYDVVYEHYTSESVMPSNPRGTFLRGLRIADDTHRTIDVPVGTVEGDILLNGEPFPASPYENGIIHALPRVPDGSPAVLGYTFDGAFSTRLLPGLYDAAYALQQGDSTVPRNELTVVVYGSRVVQGAAPRRLEIDVRAGTLVPSYSHNGVPLPTGGTDNARLYLHRGVNHLRLRDTVDGPREQVVMEGRFDVFYAYVAGTNLPRNVFMPFGCVDLVR